MSKYFNAKDYMDKRVEIKCSDKSVYRNDKIIGKCGTVTKTSGSLIGVLVDGVTNSASGYGVYWFSRNEIKIIKNESEDIKMEGYKNIAIVNLLEDYNKKDYAFALYDEDFEALCQLNCNGDALVVVNANGKDNRVLGVVKNVLTIEDYYSIDTNKGRKITAEVVGVVAMNGYIALEAEINKRKSIEYYEAMANEYADNPRLAELVKELKSLGA